MTWRTFRHRFAWAILWGLCVGLALGVARAALGWDTAYWTGVLNASLIYYLFFGVTPWDRRR